ncbi:MAG: hypothetical protein IPP94_03890 [Ignavibacteria bacterium]|nr:hypothetical protein [Ignavibacteria bacterium]
MHILGTTIAPEDLRVPYRVLGALGIGVMLFFAQRSIRLHRDARTFFLSMLMVSSSGLVVCLGYVELYAMSYALTAAFFFTMWDAFKGKGPLWLPAALLTAAAAFGASALIFLPAWCFAALASTTMGNSPRGNTRLLIALLVLTGSAAVIIATFPSGGWSGAYILPSASIEDVQRGMSFGWQRYTMFSAAHFTDIANVLLLTAGAAAVALPVLLWAGRRSGVLAQPLFQFSIVALAGALVLLFEGNAALGLARDWDIAALPSLAVLFSLVVLVDHLASTRLITFSTATIAFVLTAVVSLYSWAVLNHDGDASALRLRTLVHADSEYLLPHNTYHGFENVRKYAVKVRNGDLALGSVKDQIGTGYETMTSYRRAFDLISAMTDTERRRQELRWLLDALSTGLAAGAEPQSFRFLPREELRGFATRVLLSALQAGDAQLAREYATRIRVVAPDWKEEGWIAVFSDTTLSLDAKTALAEASTDARTAEPTLLDLLGQLYEMNARFPDAAATYEHALRRDSLNFPETYISLVRAYDQIPGSEARARETLSRLVRNCRNTAQARQAMRALEAQTQRR